MESFTGQIAVVTGGGTGMGRELVRQLAAEGCHVSMCDVSSDAMAETKALADDAAPAGTRVTSFVADVSGETAMFAFRDHVVAEQATDHVHLVFNNAGISGGGSFVTSERDEWERTYGVCWGGVYNGCRAFLPLLMKADHGHVVNTSSVNGLWASLGPGRAHTAYCAAKFAVRGFTEALIEDFRLNAPHLQAHVVFPGHIGTSIAINSMTAMAKGAELHREVLAMGEAFRDNAPMTAAEASTVILDAVRSGDWRILVGDDAHVLDRVVREHAEDSYDVDFARRAFPPAAANA